MWKMIGFVLVLGGVAGYLYSWVCEQKKKQMRLEEVIHFLQKSIFVMEKEKMKVVDYFIKYTSHDSRKWTGVEDTVLESILQEIANRLSTNTYPNGQMVWEEVFMEEEQNWSFDREVFEIILHAGNGFFGRSCAENVSFLKKSLAELEEQKVKEKEKDVQKRKVWIPVGMLGAVMVVILFI